MHEKVSKVLQLQEGGMDRNSIANELGYQRIDSLNRFMRRKGYKIIDGKFVLELKQDVEIEEKKENASEITDRKNIKFSFKELDYKVTGDIEEEYKSLIEKYSQNKLRILAMMLIKDHFDYMDKNDYEADKKKSLIRNVKTFFEVAFKGDFAKMQSFLNEHKIPYEKEELKNYKSIRLFLKNDESLNKHITQLDLEGLELLRKELSYINPFTENFQKALRINKN